MAAIIPPGSTPYPVTRQTRGVATGEAQRTGSGEQFLPHGPSRTGQSEGTTQTGRIGAGNEARSKTVSGGRSPASAANVKQVYTLQTLSVAAGVIAASLDPIETASSALSGSGASQRSSGNEQATEDRPLRPGSRLNILA